MPGPGDEMRNPFRNEADAFRVLVMFVVAAVVVIAAAELVATWLGVLLAIVAIALGAYASFGWLRVGLGGNELEPDGDSADLRRPEAGGADDDAPRP